MVSRHVLISASRYRFPPSYQARVQPLWESNREATDERARAADQRQPYISRTTRKRFIRKQLSRPRLAARRAAITSARPIPSSSSMRSGTSSGQAKFPTRPPRARPSGSSTSSVSSIAVVSFASTTRAGASRTSAWTRRKARLPFSKPTKPHREQRRSNGAFAQRATKPRRSMRDLVDLYQRSESYARLAPHTQRVYDRVLHRLLHVDGLADSSAASIGSKHIQQLVDRHAASSSGGSRPAQEAPHPVPMRHRPRLAIGRSDTRREDRPRRRRRLPSAELRSGAAVTRLRIDCFLAGLLIAVGLALLLGAAGASWVAPAAFAALSLTDALLTAVGLLVAAMTGVASVLVVADVRADAAAARAWQDINTELALVGTVVETAPAIRIDARYAAGPQDENLRRILLAHRFVVPAPSLRDAGSAAATCADAVACRGNPMALLRTPSIGRSDQLPAADRHRKRKSEAPDAAFDCPPLPIAGNVRDCDRRGQRSAKRRVSRALLVANAGVWWDCSSRFAVDVRRAPADGLRSRRDCSCRSQQPRWPTSTSRRRACSRDDGTTGLPRAAGRREPTAGLVRARDYWQIVSRKGSVASQCIGRSRRGRQSRRPRAGRRCRAGGCRDVSRRRAGRIARSGRRPVRNGKS